MADDNVTVTATLVSHYDVYPAFGFRIDLKKSGLSVTFSGDTTKSDNLITLARDTDILVHQAQFSLDDVLPQQVPSELPAEFAYLGRTGRRTRRCGQCQICCSEPEFAH
jgi:hypothetical protein